MPWSQSPCSLLHPANNKYTNANTNTREDSIPSWSLQSALCLQWHQLWPTFVESSAIHSSFWNIRKSMHLSSSSPSVRFSYLEVRTWLHFPHKYAPFRHPPQPSIFSVSPEFKVMDQLPISELFLLLFTKNNACLFLVLILFSFLTHFFQLFWCKFQLEKHLSRGEV